jgi:hypothetical protein
MQVCYDDKTYGVKWSQINDNNGYNHKTIFQCSQNRPFKMDELENIRVEYLKIDKPNIYSFFVYKRGTVKYYDGEQEDAVFYIWVPAVIEEISIILCVA